MNRLPDPQRLFVNPSFGYSKSCRHDLACIAIFIPQHGHEFAISVSTQVLPFLSFPRQFRGGILITSHGRNRNVNGG